MDPHAERLAEDERRARYELRAVYEAAGFYVLPTPQGVKLTGYFGRRDITTEEPTSCPSCALGACVRHDSLFHELGDDGPGPVRAPRRLVVRNVQRAA